MYTNKKLTEAKTDTMYASLSDATTHTKTKEELASISTDKRIAILETKVNALNESVSQLKELLRSTTKTTNKVSREMDTLSSAVSKILRR